jgi:hypothetical protein
VTNTLSDIAANVNTDNPVSTDSTANKPLSVNPSPSTNISLTSFLAKFEFSPILYSVLKNLCTKVNKLSLRKAKEAILLLLGIGSSYVSSASLSYQNETLIRSSKTLTNLTTLFDSILSDY